jgi:hypothetical protein
MFSNLHRILVAAAEQWMDAAWAFEYEVTACQESLCLSPGHGTVPSSHRFFSPNLWLSRVAAYVPFGRRSKMSLPISCRDKEEIKQ